MKLPDRIDGALEQVRPRVYALCHRVLRHPEDAEDATQNVLLKVAERLRSSGEVQNDGWLYRVTLTTSLELRRKHQRRVRHEQRKPDPAPGMSEEAWDSLHGAISELDDELRRLVVDHYFDRRTLEEIAKDAGCSTVAVWKKISKAREELKRRLRLAGHGAAIPFFGAARGPALLTTIAGGTAMAAKHGTLTIAASLAFLALGVGAGLAIAGRRASTEEVALREELARATAKVDQLSRENARANPPLAAAPPAMPVAAPLLPARKFPGPTAAYLDQMRKFVKWGNAADKAGEQDREPLAELTPFLMEIFPVLNTPSKSPDKHAQFYRAFYEISAEEAGVPFSPAQTEKLEALTEETRTSLVRAGAVPALDRRILELDVEKRLIQGFSELLTSAQFDSLPATLVNDEAMEMRNTKVIQKQTAAAEIVKAWTENYKLLDYQKPAADAAARLLVDSMNRLAERFESTHGYPPLDRAGLKTADQLQRSLQKLDYRVELAAARRDALKSLEGALTPDQQALVRSKMTHDFRIFDIEALRRAEALRREQKK